MRRCRSVPWPRGANGPAHRRTWRGHAVGNPSGGRGGAVAAAVAAPPVGWGVGMGMGSDDVMVIKVAEKAGEASVITVSCPNKTGLGYDLCRIILEFGLCFLREDASTDGRRCYFVFWVVPRSELINIQWASLKDRLMSACPSCSISFYLDSASRPTSSLVYLLKVFCVDRMGLLQDVSRILCELGLTIQGVKVSTTPDSRVVDLFFITDGM